MPVVRTSVCAICKLHVTRRSKQGSCGKSSLKWQHTNSCFCTLGSLTYLLVISIIFDSLFVYFLLKRFVSMHEKNRNDSPLPPTTRFSYPCLFYLHFLYECSQSAVRSDTNLRIHIGHVLQATTCKEAHRRLTSTSTRLCPNALFWAKFIHLPLLYIEYFTPYRSYTCWWQEKGNGNKWGDLAVVIRPVSKWTKLH